MNALFPKMSLKQKFILTFCIITIFSVYQIISDTIIEHQKNQNHYNKTQNSIAQIQYINSYVYDLQNNILELKRNHQKPFSKRLQILRQIEKLKISLSSIAKQYPKEKVYQVVLKQLAFISKNIHTLSHTQIISKYKILYKKLFLFANYHATFLHYEPIADKKLQLLYSDMPFVLNHLITLEASPEGFFMDALFLEQLQENYKHFTNLDIKEEQLAYVKKIENSFLEYTIHPMPTKHYYALSTRLIKTYHQINSQLNFLVLKDIKTQYENQNRHFNIKLCVEILAFVFAVMLLYYFYTSLFTYIRKIQNAHKIKSLFLSNMSHELRTPLNAIIGFLNILKESKDKQEQAKFIDIIYKSSKQLLYIINDILDFSKIEDAKLKIEKKPFDIKKEFELLVELFSANATAKQITLETQFAEDVPSCIVSDKFRIKQIISNLISNAIKFTPEGGIIKIILQKKEKHLFICVEDNGIGINKKSQKNIFKSFLQANDSTARKYGGTGLGLSISSKLVNLLGSKLKVSSKEYYGSRFYFLLKIKECKQKHKITKVDENKSSYQGTALLVEDNPTNQFLMQITLSNLKLDIILANDGNEAIERYKNNTIDIVFMDDNMPNKNGVEATEEIIAYEKEKGLKHVPIIALTANTGSDVKKRLLNAGMDEFMTKPFDIKLLHQILQKHLH